MTLAPWRSPLSRALYRNRSLAYARYLQLATVRADGKPANRTVVFRGFLDGSEQLKFITDERSEKVDQIAQKPWGEACWYFPKTREQFRISGSLSAIGHTHSNAGLQTARSAQWRDLSDGAREQFSWPQPGHRRSTSWAADVPSPDSNQPLPNFMLLLLEPVSVDHLELRGDPQNRWRHLRDNQLQWSTEAINP